MTNLFKGSCVRYRGITTKQRVTALHRRASHYNRQLRICQVLQLSSYSSTDVLQKAGGGTALFGKVMAYVVTRKKSVL